MGLLDNQTYQEYGLSLNYGTYQFITLDNIINSFMIANVGEDKIINKVSRTDVQFHAMRAIQELSYDVFRSIKTQELLVPNAGPSIVLPQDYVNYIKIVKVGSDGINRILYPTGKTSNPFPVTQNEEGIFQFNDSGELLPMPYLDDTPALVPNSQTFNNYQDQSASQSDSEDPDFSTDNYGRRYGLDPQHAQSNGTFFIDNLRGIVSFSSNLVGEKVTIYYVSDGLGKDHEMVVHKFCEEACYKHIAYGILATKSNIPEYIVQRYKKEKFAETRKAKIRLSNIKIEEFTQVLKGLSKPIK